MGSQPYGFLCRSKIQVPSRCHLSLRGDQKPNSSLLLRHKGACTDEVESDMCLP